MCRDLHLLMIIVTSFKIDQWCGFPWWNKGYWIVVFLPVNISTSDQSCFTVVDQRWNNVDPMLKMKQNPTFYFQRFISLIQRWCPTLSNVESMLHNFDTIISQCFTTSFQRCLNIDMTLSQRCFNVASTLVKAISKLILIVKSMDLQKNWQLLFC